MDERVAAERARTFVRGVRRISARLGTQSLSELRRSSVDVATRKTIAGLARACGGLLDDHDAKWVLDALIGLDPQIEGSEDLAETVREQEVTKETLLDWLDLVVDALDDLYRPPEDQPGLTRVITVSARIPTSHPDALDSDAPGRSATGAEAPQDH